MPTGAITGYIDVAQLTLYLFWIFFAGLILYLRREDKREGYPLVSPSMGKRRNMGFAQIPGIRTFLLANGDTQVVPAGGRPDTREIAAKPVAVWPGAPLQPTGNPMVDGVGPAAYAEREQEPERTLEGRPLIEPLRIATDFSVAEGDPDPRGWPVVGADGQVGGTVVELWIDHAEPQIRYLEVEVAGGAGARKALLPMNFARLERWHRRVEVKTILGRQFADVPGLSTPDHITKREEDQITAYYGGGQLYATPLRAEPVL